MFPYLSTTRTEIAAGGLPCSCVNDLAATILEFGLNPEEEAERYRAYRERFDL